MRRTIAAAALFLGSMAATAPLEPARAGNSTTKLGDFTIAYNGKYDPDYTRFDLLVGDWMQANGVGAAQLAFRKDGKLLFSHAYTYGADQPVTQTTNVMRLASVSKATVTAAITQLYAEKKIKPTTAVYAYLGIKKPLLKGQAADPRAKSITVQELIDHTSGLPTNDGNDPLFHMRDIELQLKKEPLTKLQFAEYLYGLPLASDPGTVEAYSNVGYLMLTLVVEKASGLPYFTYVQDKLFKPLHLTNLLLGRSKYADRSKNEVVPMPNYTGPSIFDLSSTPKSAPFNYEGGDIYWDITDGPSDLMSNAESMSAFVHNWNAYGLGGRADDYARDGCVPGVASWIESLSNGYDVSMIFNAQPCLDFPVSVIVNLRAALYAQK